MLFGALILCFVLARVKTPVWPPLEVPPFPKLLPLFSTLSIAVSSILVSKGMNEWVKAQKHLKVAPENISVAKGFSDFKFFWGLGIFAGIAFGVLQTIALGNWMRSFDVRVNVYSSSVAFLIIFHWLHFLLGMSGLCWKFYRPINRQSLRLWSWFWHFLGCVWIAIFLVLVI